jgi:hypothetical protein
MSTEELLGICCGLGVSTAVMDLGGMLGICVGCWAEAKPQYTQLRRQTHTCLFMIASPEFSTEGTRSRHRWWYRSVNSEHFSDEA